MYQGNGMQTVTIKINNAHALKLLEELEALNLIEVIKRTVAKEKKAKLSDKLWGSISTEEADTMRKELIEMRNEWQRDI